MMCKSFRFVAPATSPHWVGDGFHVYPVFNQYAFTRDISPFLMFDYAAPKNFPANQNGRPHGVGEHPHRGFETVTLALRGSIEHGDSVGNRDTIYEGDVQWMTAASGIIHEEFHSAEFSKSGGIMEMCQFWVNLPAKHKMDPPHYQAIGKEKIPLVHIPEVGSVKIIAGNFRSPMGAIKGAAKTFTELNMFFIELNEGKTLEVVGLEGHNTLIFVRTGAAEVVGNPVSRYQVAFLSEAGDSCFFTAKAPDTHIIFLSGIPINEPIAARGPFVMNTQGELRQAMADYQNGRMGQMP